MKQQCCMELVGTFFLTLAISFTANALAIGTMLTALVYVGWHVSGAHYNPAVTLMMALRGKFNAKKTACYMLSQVAGAFLAGVYFTLIRGQVYVPPFAQQLDVWVSMSAEILLTSLLCAVILVVATRMKGNDVFGLVIGLTFVAVVSLGGLANPAVALGSRLYAAARGANLIEFNEFFVLVVAPLIGGFVTVHAHKHFNK